MIIFQKLKDADVKGKRVLVRVDFNVVLSGKKGSEKIVDDFRIRASLPTIKYLFKKKAKVILISHLGKGNESLRPVANHLQKMLNKKVVFVDDCIGEKVLEKTKKMKNGDILFLENLRFYKEEEKNDFSFAKKLSLLSDVYVNDAFGACHRAHASIVSLPKYLPSFAGLLLEKEINILEKILMNPVRPLSVFIGGAKISTKIKLISRFLKFSDDVILGGALANTVLKAKGFNVGKSLIEVDIIKRLKKNEFKNRKLHLPADVIVSSDGVFPRVRGLNEIKDNESILDIGPESLSLFEEITKKSGMIFWNGPFGFFEKEKFAKGSCTLARIIAKSPAYKIIGGGETISILTKLRLLKKMNHISTGGGAMLEFLSGNKLPGLEALKQNL